MHLLETMFLTFQVFHEWGTTTSLLAFQGSYFNQPGLLYSMATGWVVDEQWLFLSYSGWDYEVRVSECQGSRGTLLLSGK